VVSKRTMLAGGSKKSVFAGTSLVDDPLFNSLYPLFNPATIFCLQTMIRPIII